MGKVIGATAADAVRTTKRLGLLLAGVSLLGVAACGEVHPDHGSGAADIPATAGGLAGAAEGSPGNAANIGSNSSIVVPGTSGGH